MGLSLLLLMPALPQGADGHRLGRGIRHETAQNPSSSSTATIMLRTLCIVAVYTFFTGASARMEDPVLLAVNTLLLQLFTLFSYMNDGFAYAAEALTDGSSAPGDVKALRDCLRRCIAWGTAVSVLFVGIYIVWWRDLVGLFIDDSAANAATIVEVAGRYIVWIILIPVASAMPFIMDGIMVGATQTRVMRNSMFWATAAYFGIFYIGHTLIGNNALWLAFTLYMFLRGVLQYFMTHSLRTIYRKPAHKGGTVNPRAGRGRNGPGEATSGIRKVSCDNRPHIRG